MNIKRRSLEQERTAVHCDYFCVRPMLMLGPQPPSLVSDHGSLPGEEPLCYHYIFFHPSSPPIATPGRPPLGHTPGRHIYWREDLPVRSLTLDLLPIIQCIGSNSLKVNEQLEILPTLLWQNSSKQRYIFFSFRHQGWASHCQYYELLVQHILYSSLAH